MRDYPIKRAARLTGTLIVHRHGGWEEVTNLRRWGGPGCWEVTTDKGQFIADEHYMLKRPKADELKRIRAQGDV